MKTTRKTVWVIQILGWEPNRPLKWQNLAEYETQKQCFEHWRGSYSKEHGFRCVKRTITEKVIK